MEIVTSTFVDLMADRGDSERIWASVLKRWSSAAIRVSARAYGFRSPSATCSRRRPIAACSASVAMTKGAYVFRAPARPALAPITNAGRCAHLSNRWQSRTVKDTGAGGDGDWRS